jgi:hypothetical protein
MFCTGETCGTSTACRSCRTRSARICTFHPADRRRLLSRMAIEGDVDSWNMRSGQRCGLLLAADFLHKCPASTESSIHSSETVEIRYPHQPCHLNRSAHNEFDAVRYMVLVAYALALGLEQRSNMGNQDPSAADRRSLHIGSYTSFRRSRIWSHLCLVST